MLIYLFNISLGLIVLAVVFLSFRFSRALGCICHWLHSQTGQQLLQWRGKSPDYRAPFQGLENCSPRLVQLALPHDATQWELPAKNWHRSLRVHVSCDVSWWHKAPPGRRPSSGVPRTQKLRFPLGREFRTIKGFVFKVWSRRELSFACFVRWHEFCLRNFCLPQVPCGLTLTWWGCCGLCLLV